jgi:hypothetical protein
MIHESDDAGYWQMKYDAARQAAAQDAYEQAWQPIATAPKDGTEILLIWHWDSGIHTGVSVVLAAWICRKHRHLSLHHDCPDDPECDMGWGHYAGTMTHWMPLPDASRALAAAEAGKEGEK